MKQEAFEGMALINVYNIAGQRMLIQETNSPQTEIQFNGSDCPVHCAYPIQPSRVFNQSF
ncbi:MAG: hypothetical protein IPJ40_16930 [Saprospirales bacterium]|nr:hypothetical protein [Saprospirales bacterium]